MKSQRRLFVTCVGLLLLAVELCWTTYASDDQPAQSQPAADKKSASPLPDAYQSRSASRRENQLADAGGTAESDQGVAAAINWLARHQNADGSWGCTKFTTQCKDPSCTVHLRKDGADYPMAATAFGLLPLLASGQTHDSKGPYQQVIRKGLLWITTHQDQKTGRLGTESMYEHGLGTIAICEAYGLSQDAKLRVPLRRPCASRRTLRTMRRETGITRRIHPGSVTRRCWVGSS